MKFIGTLAAATLFFCSLPLSTDAQASVLVVVDKSEQRMSVSENGKHLYTWKVSTGKSDRWTHNGTFGVQSLSPKHRSRKYNNSPMPHSIFYDGNRAIHGTDYVGKLGRRDSMGCVRLHRANAMTLFNLIKDRRRDLVIVIKN